VLVEKSRGWRRAAFKTEEEGESPLVGRIRRVECVVGFRSDQNGS
jgi:hypothetical protein